MGTFQSVMYGGVVASGVLHHRLLDRILHAPMAFFDTTPLGRIVNRFSTDMDRIDSTIPTYLKFQGVNIGLLAATFSLIAYSTYMFLVALLPLGVVFYLVMVRPWVLVFHRSVT